MVWFILLGVSLLVSLGVLGIAGGLGGFMLLVILNGFSESQATPIIGCYGLGVLGLNVAITTAINRLVTKIWFAEAGISFGGTLILSVGITAVLLACGATILWLR